MQRNLKAFDFEVWEPDGYTEYYLVLAESEEEAEEKLCNQVELEDFDYRLNDDNEYSGVII